MFFLLYKEQLFIKMKINANIQIFLNKKLQNFYLYKM